MSSNSLSNLDLWAEKRTCEAIIAPYDITVTTSTSTNILQPDVVLICDLEKIDVEGRYQGTPIIVVEVLSDGTKGYDLIKKLDVYRQSGVLEYWIANPQNEEILVYTFAEGEISDYRVFRKDESIISRGAQELTIELKLVFN